MNPGNLYAIAIVGGAIALAIIGLALRMRRLEREAQARTANTKAQAAQPDAAPEAEGALQPQPESPTNPQPEPTPPAPQEAAARGDDLTEVVRVLREQEGNTLVVEMAGQLYRSVNEIKDQKQGLDLVDAVLDLQQFLGLDLVATIAAKENAPPPPVPATPAELELIQRPSFNPIRQMMILRDREAKKAREQQEAARQPGSIVEEIEAILVRRLTESPFQGRSIHMRPGLHGGAHIDVDGRGYEAIDDVEDEDVKQFLKSVIAEWEAGTP